MTRVALVLVVMTTVAHAQPAPGVQEPAPRKTPFDRGKFGLSLGAGSSSSFGFRYFVIGGGAGYFVLDGLEVGLAGAIQWGDGPTIGRLTPGVRYIAHPLVGHSPLIPYVGVFYSHWFIGGGDLYRDQDAVGTRGGLLYVSGSVILGLGIAYERIVSECMPTADDECWSVYPDLTISISL